MPVEWGTYRLEVTSADANGPASSVTFNAGWYGGQSADSPEVLEVSLDKASYKPGETAKLNIVPNGAGKAMIAILREGLISTREVDVPEGGTSVDLPVDAALAPGAYVTATLYRPMDVAAKRMPWRYTNSSARFIVSSGRGFPGCARMGLTNKQQSFWESFI